ncbi:histidine utilization repressor [Ralstonia solanacearum]|uniref:histidine utilization repressor n=1 Tax=Ralstonia solanacearum TaxID=305 RepID=UPI0006DC9EB9|nr:histidine utilization repressor [Ralstonia solanacearum]QHB55626.1 histidine utilization repressor [Ralstonia solanacearum]
MPPRQSAPAPAFQRIKEDILSRIRSGEWQEGEMIPGETSLAQTFGVSRMTVNRALRELTAEQILTRVQGSGTFVAQQKYQATLVAIRNIAEEIAARGHRHRAELHRLERVRATEGMAAPFGLAVGRTLFHSLIVHFENDLPIQVEDRWVNAELAPDYMEQDFTQTTPNAYLMRAAPLQGVEYRIEARLPPREIAEMLHMDVREACLMLRRKTLSQGQVASVATMWHPGGRYQFTGSF